MNIAEPEGFIVPLGCPEMVPKGSGTCRLCLRVEYRLIMIFAQGGTSVRLRSRILDCCPVKLLEDARLPNAICFHCEKKVAAIYEFREQCRESERTLRFPYESCPTSEHSRPAAAINPITVSDDSIQMNRRPENEMTGFGKENEVAAFNGGGETVGRKEQSVAARLSTYTPIRRNAALKENCRIEQVDVKEGRVDSMTVVESRETLQLLSQPVLSTAMKMEESAGGGCKSSTNRQYRVDANYRFKEGATANKDLEARYLCDICSRTFLSKSGLRYHVKSHHETKPYFCRYCGKGFAIPSYVKRHESVHSNEKRLICHVCDTKFASPNGLRYHLRIHTGEANYRCEVCRRSFRRRKYLMEHAYTHTGEKPYACKHCGSSYRNSGSLFVHEKACRSRIVQSLATETNLRYPKAIIATNTIFPLIRN